MSSSDKGKKNVVLRNCLDKEFISVLIMFIAVASPYPELLHVSKVGLDCYLTKAAKS